MPSQMGLLMSCAPLSTDVKCSSCGQLACWLAKLLAQDCKIDDHNGSGCVQATCEQDLEQLQKEVARAEEEQKAAQDEVDRQQQRKQAVDAKLDDATRRLRVRMRASSGVGCFNGEGHA